MGITRISIDNYKSIKHCDLELKDIDLLIGENGSGKSNLLSALQFFYNNLISYNEEVNIFDYNNKFNNYVKISITYDFKILNIRSYNQLKNEDTQYKNYYKRIIQISRDDKLTVTLTKIKDKKITWDCDLNTRKMIYNLFPLYIVDSRSINLINWKDIWQEIGDLIKVESKLEEKIQKELDEIIEDEEYKLKDTFSRLETMFSHTNIKIKKFTPKQFASYLSNVYFNGKEFEFKDNKLDRFSNGTNAFNYINLLINVLKLIASKKMKCPVVLLDEPEISLHHKLIDELTNQIFECSIFVQCIISTHSPRLLKNILRDAEENCNIYHMRLCDLYTNISNVRLFDFKNDYRHKIIITDQHANAYFSKIIMMVEGESELEVFSNRYLQELFPILKYTDVMQGMSNDVVNEIISPLQRKYNTPVIMLRDMDKIITVDPKLNKVTPTKIFHSFSNREKYYYTSLRADTIKIRKRIDAMCNKCKFHYKLPFYSIMDNNYIELIELIQKYFKIYNTYVAATTLEGMLITDRNYELFYSFVKSRSKRTAWLSDFELLYNMFSSQEQLNFVRLMFNGKSDYILTFKQICKANSKIAPLIVKTIETGKVSKTEGWMTEWLEYYFCSIARVNTDNPFIEFKKKMKNKDEKEVICKKFKSDFSELNELIDMINQANS